MDEYSIMPLGGTGASAYVVFVPNPRESLRGPRPGPVRRWLRARRARRDVVHSFERYLAER